ncbi:hypothetical protein, partial [Desulfovibrio piger]|uniref:hypothetical protein n=1 Tax=Desulfovibrio piger TaxID=901 RepID=UPI003F0334BC
LCAFSTPPSSIFPQKNLWFLPPTDCLFNQYTEKTNKFAYIFFLRTAMRLPQRLLPQASISSIISFEEKYFLLSFPSFLQLAGACRTVLPLARSPVRRRQPAISSSRLAGMPAGCQASDKVTDSPPLPFS